MQSLSGRCLHDAQRAEGETRIIAEPSSSETSRKARAARARARRSGRTPAAPGQPAAGSGTPNETNTYIHTD